MKIDLGFFYISIDRGGIHIEIEKELDFWLVFSFTNRRGFSEVLPSDLEGE